MIRLCVQLAKFAVNFPWQGWRVANLRPLFEPILWFQKPYKTGGTLADNLLEYGVGTWNENALIAYNLRQSEIDKSTMSNILKVDIGNGDQGLHETQKPIKLMELLISLVTEEQ